MRNQDLIQQQQYYLLIKKTVRCLPSLRLQILSDQIKAIRQMMRMLIFDNYLLEIWKMKMESVVTLSPLQELIQSRVQNRRRNSTAHTARKASIYWIFSKFMLGYILVKSLMYALSVKSVLIKVVITKNYLDASVYYQILISRCLFLSFYRVSKSPHPNAFKKSECE